MTTMNAMPTETYEYFIAALRLKLRELKREKRKNNEPFTQKQYAREVLGITPAHFSGIMNNLPGRRASEELQERIANAFGFGLMDFLDFGKKLVLNDLALKDNNQTITGDGNVQTGGNVSGTVQNVTETECDLRPDVYKLAKLMQLIESPIEIKKLTLKYEEAVKEYDL